MFWKKKNKAKQPLFTYESSCRRESYRVNPPVFAPVEVQFGKETGTLINISAGGLAFRCGRLKPGDTQPVAIDLPGERITVSAEVEIMNIDAGKACHGRFLDLAPEMLEAVHHYALSMQKEELRAKRAENKKAGIRPRPGPPGAD